jgi:hypothetical protein
MRTTIHRRKLSKQNLANHRWLFLTTVALLKHRPASRSGIDFQPIHRQPNNLGIDLKVRLLHCGISIWLCLLEVKSMHYRAAALLSGPPQ